MKNFLRNSRPLPYKTLATGILFNGVIEYHKEDMNEENTIELNNIKDGTTVLLFGDDIDELKIDVKFHINLKNYERFSFDFDAKRTIDVDSFVFGYNFYDDGDNYVELLISKKSIGLIYTTNGFTIEGESYEDTYMPLYVNKIGNLIFFSKQGEM